VDKEVLNILRKIVGLKSVSLYDLAESYAREKRTQVTKVFDEVNRIVFQLASKTLVTLEVTEGIDGLETWVKSTPTGETYVKSPVPLGREA